jgi:hypothetical protein
VYRKTLQTSVAAVALFAFAAPFAGPVSAAGNTIVNGKSQVKVAITGQVSRVVAVVDDGNTTNIHHGSNQFSGNRVRFIGTAKAWESLTIGTRIEFQFNNRTSNASGNFLVKDEKTFAVKARDEDTGDGTGIDARYQDITFAGKWGKVYVGKGDSASNGTSEVDLSGTILASNPSVADLGFGGSHFIVANPTFTAPGEGSMPVDVPPDPNLQSKEMRVLGPRASTVFTSFDGLSRTQRVRYDTPSFGGFKVSVGLNQGPRGDAALRYSGSFGGTKVSAAIAWFNTPGKSEVGNQFSGSGSILHSSGLNATVAGGTQERSGDGDSDASMMYFKLGYKAKIFGAGSTNFYVNYQNTNDLATQGDDATYWGFGVVQLLKDYATELFAAFSIADFDDSKSNTYENLTTGLVGARVKF